MREQIDYPSAASYTATITADLLAGYTLAASEGCIITVDTVQVSAPYTFLEGQQLVYTHLAGVGVLSNMRLLTPDDGAPSGSTSSGARLSDTQRFNPLLPYAASGGNFPTMFSSNSQTIVYAQFEIQQAIPLEGFYLLIYSGLNADDISGCAVTDSLGQPLDLGTFTATPFESNAAGILGTWSNPRMIPPGSYTLSLYWKPEARPILRAKGPQTLLRGLTALNFQRDSGDQEFPARLQFVTGPGSVAGTLDPYGMRVVSIETASPDWQNGAVEIVAAQGAVPYLRMRHEFNDYRLDFTLAPPPGGGGEAT